MSYIKLNYNIAASLLPIRKKDGHKGSFGRAFAYIGSSKYIGAAHLALETMLRGGAGYIEVATEKEVIDGLLLKYPEAIYNKLSKTEILSEEEKDLIYHRSIAADATLIGCGCGSTEALARITEALLLLDTEKPLILDADAINSISHYSSISFIENSKRSVILTPHEMEFSRLSGLSIESIRSDRVGVAKEFAEKLTATVILKGKDTVITDGKVIYINPTGCTALAKGGSGDTLAGLITSLIASSNRSAVEISALACYIHGLAGDRLSDELSEFGVTPSDLPREMAKIIAYLSKLNS